MAYGDGYVGINQLFYRKAWKGYGIYVPNSGMGWQPLMLAWDNTSLYGHGICACPAACMGCEMGGIGTEGTGCSVCHIGMACISGIWG